MGKHRTTTERTLTANHLPQRVNFVKRVVTAVALVGSSIALAAPALADDPPPIPVTTGPHTMSTQSGNVFTVTAALDCGPACFSWADESTRDEFRWVGDRWFDAVSGISTPDGITYTNRNGRTATMS